MADSKSTYYTAQSKVGDPHLDQEAVNTYWPPYKDGVEIPGRASQIISDAAMAASVTARTPAEVKNAKAALDHLIADFPDAAAKAVEKLGASGNNPMVYDDAIALITHDMKENGILGPGTTPAPNGARKSALRR